MRTISFKIFITILFIALLPSCTESEVNISFNETTTDIKPSSSFTLTIPHHLPELAITDTDNNWFYLQGSSLKQTYYPQDTFTQLKKITLHPDELYATQWINGKETFSKVFSKPGIYTIYLSDNLETEPDNAKTLIKKIRLVH